MSGYKLRSIREKAETVFETDANPAAADAVLCLDLVARPLEGDWQQQDFVTGVEGAQPEDLYGVHAAAEYKVEAAPSGIAGTPPAYAHLLKSSGLSEVVTTDTVAYSPTPADGVFGSTTMQIRNAVMKMNVVGCRGSIGFNAEVGRKPQFTLRRRGRFAEPEAYDNDPNSFASWRRAIDCTPENMFAFTLGETKLCVRSFSFTDGRDPVVDKYMNCGGTDISGYRYTGRMTVKWPTLAAKNLIMMTKNGTTEPLVFEQGTAAGEKIRISGPKVQIKFAGEEDIQGDLGATLDLVFQADQGNDDILIEFL